MIEGFLGLIFDSGIFWGRKIWQVFFFFVFFFVRLDLSRDLSRDFLGYSTEFEDSK